MTGTMDPNGLKIGIRASRSGHLDPGISIWVYGRLDLGIWASRSGHLGITIRASGHLDLGIWASRSGHLGISIRASGHLDPGIWATRSGLNFCNFRFLHHLGPLWPKLIDDSLNFSPLNNLGLAEIFFSQIWSICFSKVWLEVSLAYFS